MFRILFITSQFTILKNQSTTNVLLFITLKYQFTKQKHQFITNQYPLCMNKHLFIMRHLTQRAIDLFIMPLTTKSIELMDLDIIINLKAMKFSQLIIPSKLRLL